MTRQGLDFLALITLCSFSACNDGTSPDPDPVPTGDFSGSWDVARTVNGSGCGHDGQTELISLTILQADDHLRIRDLDGDLAGTVVGRTASLRREDGSLEFVLTLSGDGNGLEGSGVEVVADCTDVLTISGNKVTACGAVATGAWKFLLRGSSGAIAALISGEVEQEHCGLYVWGPEMQGVLHGVAWEGRGLDASGLGLFRFAGEFSSFSSFFGTWETEDMALGGVLEGERGTFGPITPESFLLAYAEALSEKSLSNYEALLDERFEFYILPSDADDFPWVPGGFWGRTEELDIMSNMMDPGFDGDERPVETIEVAYEIQDQQDVGADTTRVTADFVITVLVAPDTGWLVETRLEFELVRRPDGELVARTQWELPILGPLSPKAKRDLSVEALSWGKVKNLYR